MEVMSTFKKTINYKDLRIYNSYTIKTLNDIPLSNTIETISYNPLIFNLRIQIITTFTLLLWMMSLLYENHILRSILMIYSFLEWKHECENYILHLYYKW